MSVLAARLLQIRGRRDDYLGLALLISIAVHGGLLAVRFAAPSAPPPPDTTLEVVLLNVQGDMPALQPQVLAQYDFDGGGRDDAGVASTPLPLTATDTPHEVVLAAMLQRQKELEAEQERLFALLQARADAPATPDSPQPDNPPGDPGEDELRQESLVINARIAALKEKIEHYNARPRHHFIGPSAASAPEARYVEAWRQKIELLGTEHYPLEARGKIYGSLQLTVYIRRDGSLERVEIDQPAAHAVLNQAALRIVQLAAPFPPLPPELARDTDILAITRTWNFTHEQLETRLP
ncbi:MAG: TonB family protein [Alcaligenaceae bacterium]|nr:TonB family protein [Alcaligenaceae bacterium]